jgi:hypothetical protein
MTDYELAAASEAIKELRVEVRADLAEDLGGDPGDYRAAHYFAALAKSEGETDETVPDGGK